MDFVVRLTVMSRLGPILSSAHFTAGDLAVLREIALIQILSGVA